MKVVLTGSSGRLGRAIFGALAPAHDVAGIDRRAFATTRIIGDVADRSVLERAMDGADAVIHTAALHAPHVGVQADAEFERINDRGLRLLIDVAQASGVPRIVFTSTTALYGHAIAKGACTWVDEDTPPQPKSIYHRTKLAGEQALAEAASEMLAVRVIRMSRCFPEPADRMAAYRLHRGVDVRDVADAHVLALSHRGPQFERFIISGATPFLPSDVGDLATRAASLIEERVPDLAASFRQRGWDLPRSIDRVYSPVAALESLGWRSRFGPEEVIAQLDRRSLEVLPPGAVIEEKAE